MNTNTIERRSISLPVEAPSNEGQWKAIIELASKQGSKPCYRAKTLKERSLGIVGTTYGDKLPGDSYTALSKACIAFSKAASEKAIEGCELISISRPTFKEGNGNAVSMSHSQRWERELHTDEEKKVARLTNEFKYRQTFLRSFRRHLVDSENDSLAKRVNTAEANWIEALQKLNKYHDVFHADVVKGVWAEAYEGLNFDAWCKHYGLPFDSANIKPSRAELEQIERDKKAAAKAAAAAAKNDTK